MKMSALYAEEEIPSLKKSSIETEPNQPIKMIEDLCTNPPTHCEPLCHALRSEESHAVALEATARGARAMADKAKYQELSMQKTLEAVRLAENQPSNIQPDPKRKSKMVGILLQMLFPNSKSRNQVKVSKFLNDGAIEARKQADEACLAAEAAENAAEKARAAAQKTRLFFERCTGKKESETPAQKTD